MAAAISTPDPTVHKPPRPRRWIPISVRLFVAALLLFGAISAWHLFLRHQAIQRIVALHQGSFGVVTPRGPAWLRSVLGEERMRSVGRVNDQLYLPFCNVTVDDMKLFRSLPEVRLLSLQDTPTTDAHLVALQGASHLTVLALMGTEITDAGLDSLKALPNLRGLSLGNTRITDDGLRRLATFGGIRTLDLDETAITDDGVAALKNLTNLDGLCLRSTSITDAGVAHLASFKQLDTLWLTNTAVTDAGLESLHRLSKLDFVDLSGTKVTDAGIESLVASLPALRWLGCLETQVTDEMVQRIKEKRPGLKISNKRKTGG